MFFSSYSAKIICVKNDDISTEPTTFIFLNYWIHQPIAQILRKWRLSSFRRPRTLLSLDLHEILLRFERPPYAKKIKRELKCAQTKKERKSCCCTMILSTRRYNWIESADATSISCVSFIQIFQLLEMFLVLILNCGLFKSQYA